MSVTRIALPVLALLLALGNECAAQAQCAESRSVRYQPSDAGFKDAVQFHNDRVMKTGPDARLQPEGDWTLSAETLDYLVVRYERQRCDAPARPFVADCNGAACAAEGPRLRAFVAGDQLSISACSLSERRYTENRWELGEDGHWQPLSRRAEYIQRCPQD
ncbi:MAG: hypothetical protein U1F26_14340 [Lysobacterales bacterium]